NLGADFLPAGDGDDHCRAEQHALPVLILLSAICPGTRTARADRKRARLVSHLSSQTLSRWVSQVNTVVWRRLVRAANTRASLSIANARTARLHAHSRHSAIPGCLPSDANGSTHARAFTYLRSRLTQNRWLFLPRSSAPANRQRLPGLLSRPQHSAGGPWVSCRPQSTGRRPGRSGLF